MQVKTIKPFVAGAGIDYRFSGRAVWKCPHCQTETTAHNFMTPDGLWLETHHCPTHGAVMPAGEAR